MECDQINMYIYSMHFLIQGEENVKIENRLDNIVKKGLGKEIDFVSASIDSITGTNWGRCCKCNCWVSDYSKDYSIRQFSNGSVVGNDWYCDLCLPCDHPNAF